MWLTQYSGTNYRVDNSDAVLEVLKAKNIPFAAVGTIPMSNEITGLEGIDLNGKVLAYGSTKLVKLVKELNLNPGVFFDYSTFNAYAWGDFLEEFMLNNYTIEPIRFLRDKHIFRDTFVRPVLDLKQFSGSIAPAGSTYEEFFAEKFNGTDYDDNILVARALPKTIHAEWRAFIVNRRVVTGSLYRIAGELKPSADFPPQVAAWAERIGEKYWLPHDHCVMDIAMTDDGLHIMEFNCINASGLYKADAEKLVDAMNALLV